MKRYTPKIIRYCDDPDDLEMQEDPEGDYVAYADVQAKHQLLLDLIAANDGDAMTYLQISAVLNDLANRARELTK